MLRKILFGAFIALCLIGGIYWFSYTKNISTPITDGINAIPVDAAVIFESKQAKNTWKKLSQTNIMWEELLGTSTVSELNNNAVFIDSILQLYPTIYSLLEEHSVCISLHPNNNKSFNILYVYSLPNLNYQSEIENFFEKLNKGRALVYSDFENAKTTQISVASKTPLHLSIVSGTLLLSNSQELLQASIHQLNSGYSLAKDPQFNKIMNAAGKNVDANVYINYKTLSTLLHPCFAPSAKQQIQSLSTVADYSGWDISVKPNALMLSGFTNANDSASTNYLSIFSKQKPQTIEMPKILPSKTALFVFLGISNMKSFQTDYQKWLQEKNKRSNYANFVKSTNQQYNCDIESSFLSWIDNEAALVVTENGSGSSGNSFAVFHSNTPEEALQKLNALSDSICVHTKEKPDTSSYKNHNIGHINLLGVLPQLMGEQFKAINNNYYTQLNDYLVFANDLASIQTFISEFENNKTLANDKNYISFSENMSTEANVYIYSAIARSSGIYSAWLNEQLSKDIETHIDLFHKFEACGIQFSANNKLFYSNIFLKYNPSYKKETGTLWEYKLDTTISAKPFLLINHNTKAKDVLVQDDANKIYLISNTGKILWTKQLHEKIRSEVIQVDVLKNNKLQMVFNTGNTIYMFDRNGNDMKGFPIELKSPATNAISVVDYENNRDYRIFIACENKKILCFDATGKMVDGFKFDKTNNPVYVPVQYFNAGNKDHLCIIDVKGKIYILDRKGNIRVRIKEELAQGVRNFFVEPGKDYTKTYIVAADSLGNIIKVSLSGDKEKMKFQDFETSPYVEYRDINNDKTKEFIFLTRNELKVFNADKSLLFNYQFKSEMSALPQFFLFPDGSGKIGVASETSNELYLFNDNGSLMDNFPLTGKTAFSIGDLNNEGTFNLITGSSDNSIFVYQLQ